MGRHGYVARPCGACTNRRVHRVRMRVSHALSGALLVLGAALYLNTVHTLRAACDDARARASQRRDEIVDGAYLAYSSCAWDSPSDCGIRATGSHTTVASSGGISPMPTGAAAFARRETHVHEAWWCPVVRSMPGIPFAAAAPVELVVSRERTLAFEEAVTSFRHQCDCGWVWPFVTPANYDYKISYEFIRSGLDADALVNELKRAAVFYDRFGGAIETWVQSVKGARRDHMMSDHGMLHQHKLRHACLIIRYILVVFTYEGGGGGGVGGGGSGSNGDGGGGEWASMFHFMRGSTGTFTVAMSEVQITSWPAANCDCTHDITLQTRLRDAVDAQMKTHFAHSASNFIRLIAASHDEVTPNVTVITTPSGTGGGYNIQ